MGFRQASIAALEKAGRRWGGALVMTALLAGPAGAQEVGWHYSPLPNEGDRAALGCARESGAETFACLAVRCEDDFTVGIHIHTSRPEGDLGEWRVTVDRERFSFVAAPSDAPYGGRLEGDMTVLLHSLRHGEAAYLDPPGGGAAPRNYIPLDGSLEAITQALAFCAPRVPPEAPEAEVGPAPEPMMRPQ